MPRDRERHGRAHRERDRDRRDVEVAVERLRPDLGRRRRLRHLRRVVVVRVEALRRLDPERVLRLPCELREQVGDELLVLARRVGAAELVARPVAGVEAREERLRRGATAAARASQPPASPAVCEYSSSETIACSCAFSTTWPLKPYRRIQGPLGRESRNGGTDANARTAAAPSAGSCEERGRARERLRSDGLRHAGRPRRAAAREAELVLPEQPTAARDRARDERVGERARRVDVARCRGVVQRAEVRERVELEAETREPAVHDAVVVGDVDAHRRADDASRGSRGSSRAARRATARAARCTSPRAASSARAATRSTSARSLGSVLMSRSARVTAVAVAQRVGRLHPVPRDRVRDAFPRERCVVRRRRMRDGRNGERERGGDPGRRASHLRVCRRCRL